MLNKISLTIYRVLSSKKFIYVIGALLIIQAAWFALTALYPMAFDESFHLGIIQFYSHQWLPFMTSQPPGSESYGDLTRYDSYMYHYLMSFPYRLIDSFTHVWGLEIIIMRFINIAIFTTGIFLFHKVLRRIHISEALTNFSLLMLVLIPVVPFLAATINYDNLVFLAVPLFVNFVITCSEQIRTNHKLSALSIVSLFASGVFGSLVKYAFAPIFVAGVLYIVILWLRTPSKIRILKSVFESFKKQRRLMQIIIVITLIVSGGLFTERYGVNLLQYHRFEPDCQSVRELSDCLQYGPWSRNYKIEANVKITNPPHDPPMALFLPTWVGTSMNRLYFAINNDFVMKDPLPVPIITASVIGGLGFILCLFYWESILKFDRYLLLIGLVIALYVAGLLYINFTEYLKFRTVVAVNGRYLIIIMPFIFAWIGLAYRHLFASLPKKLYNKNSLAISSLVVLLLVLNGGGALTFLLRSQPNWYFKDTPAPAINNELKNIIQPFVVGGDS